MRMKKTCNEKIRALKESCAQQVAEKSRRIALVVKMLSGVKEEVVAGNQTLHSTQKTLFTQLEKLLGQYQELEILKDQ